VPASRPQPEQAAGTVQHLSGAGRRVRAADWLRDFASGGASGSQQAGQTGLPHAVTLDMRWFRAEGRITPRYRGDDIVRHVVDGDPGPFDYVVSATLPDGAFDMREPPSWTPHNPRPPPRTPQFNWRP
jgi:hypothetical protein